MFGQEVLDLMELEIRNQFYLGKSRSQLSEFKRTAAYIKPK